MDRFSSYGLQCKHAIIREKNQEAIEMRSEVMWQDFCRASGLAKRYALGFCFRRDRAAPQDPWAQLVMAGKKTATCSAKLLYEVEDEPLPEA